MDDCMGDYGNEGKYAGFGMVLASRFFRVPIFVGLGEVKHISTRKLCQVVLLEYDISQLS